MSSLASCGLTAMMGEITGFGIASNRRPSLAAQTESKGEPDRPRTDDGLAFVVHEDRIVVPGGVAQQAFHFIVTVEHRIDEPLLDRARPGLRH